MIAQGPGPFDTPFHAIRLEDGTYRGFVGNSESYAIDGSAVWEMGGPLQQVMGPTGPGTYGECGMWLNDTYKVDDTVYGFVHVERDCSYSNNFQTHKAMAIATSLDEGLTWNVHGQFLTGRDNPTPGKQTGEGDCTVVRNGAFFYAFCLRVSDWKTIVARAPVSDPRPGRWRKYHDGAWVEPGLGGRATAVSNVGPKSAFWEPTGWYMLARPSATGQRLGFGISPTQFVPLAEPLMPADANDWVRPAPTELSTYTSFADYETGDNRIGNEFLMSYTWVPINESFAHKHLVFRDVEMELAQAGQLAQVGVALSRWHSALDRDTWVTTGPVPDNFDRYLHDEILGYLMTQAHSSLATNRLIDCVGVVSTGHYDHLLTNESECPAGFEFIRTSGWVFAAPQPGTVPLYRCLEPVEINHFASRDEDCGGEGEMQWFLGYMLAD